MSANPFSRSARSTSRGHALVRVVAVTAAMCIGGALTYAATAPSALAATVAAGIDGGAWFPHGHSHAQVHAHFEQVLTRAGATDAQRAQIDDIVKQAMQSQHADMARYHDSLHRMKTLLAAPRLDAAALEGVRSQQDQLLLDTNRRLTETLVRIAQVLTPAQRQALSADIDRMMSSRMGHHPTH